MTVGLLLLIALSVAMDVTAVAASFALKRFSMRDITKLAITFGSFQFAMACAGALGGHAAERYLERWDHWIAFALLAWVGGKMIHEALEDHCDDIEKIDPTLPLHTLLVLGVATSLDALAVGATLPTLELPLVASAAVIGIVSFAMSYFGAWAGRRIGEKFGSRVEILGGAVLIAIGVWTVVEHLTGG
ncbi:MAG: manganese efflux pump MntP family protein [Thermoanaerobaculia bacterium]|jgi:putative Mn2+ efflux pump MntP